MDLIKILQSDDIHSHQKLLHVLFDVGFATREQLCDILSWNATRLNNQLAFLKKLEKRNGKSYFKTVDLNRPDRGRPIRAYSLTAFAIQEIKVVRGIETRIQPPKPYQLNHYLGITSILARMIGKMNFSNRQYFGWWSEFEARTFIIEKYVQKMRSATNIQPNAKEISKCVSPDALLQILNQSFWIEFDNNTEGRKKLEERYFNYIRTIRPHYENFRFYIQTIDFPVIWVTASKKRLQYMKGIWKNLIYSYLRNPSYGRTNFPQMYFFVAGSERKWMIEFAKIQYYKDMSAKE